MRKIDPSEYMIDGWDQQSYPSYRRGSLHNKVGMTIMWTYYLIIILWLQDWYGFSIQGRR